MFLARVCCCSGGYMTRKRFSAFAKTCVYLGENLVGFCWSDQMFFLPQLWPNTVPCLGSCTLVGQNNMWTSYSCVVLRFYQQIAFPTHDTRNRCFVAVHLPFTFSRFHLFVLAACFSDEEFWGTMVHQERADEHRIQTPTLKRKQLLSYMRTVFKVNLKTFSNKNMFVLFFVVHLFLNIWNPLWKCAFVIRFSCKLTFLRLWTCFTSFMFRASCRTIYVHPAAGYAWILSRMFQKLQVVDQVDLFRRSDQTPLVAHIWLATFVSVHDPLILQRLCFVHVFKFLRLSRCWSSKQLFLDCVYFWFVFCKDVNIASPRLVLKANCLCVSICGFVVSVPSWSDSFIVKIISTHIYSINTVSSGIRSCPCYVDFMSLSHWRLTGSHASSIFCVGEYVRFARCASTKVFLRWLWDVSTVRLMRLIQSVGGSSFVPRTSESQRHRQTHQRDTTEGLQLWNYFLTPLWLIDRG